MSTTSDMATILANSWYDAPMRNAPAVQPIFQSAAWRFESLDHAEAIFAGSEPGTRYGTDGVPNVTALEHTLALLEGGAGAVCTGSGAAALALVLLTLLKPGDRVIVGADAFGGTVSLLKMLETWDIQAHYVDVGDFGAIGKHLDRGAAILLAESVANPTMRVADLPALATIAHARECPLVVDNTLATPFHCRPMEMGADVVIESTTKALAGHFDVVGGAAIASDVLVARLRNTGRVVGTAPAPLAAWLVSRGLPSFPLRQSRASSSAHTIAARLSQHPKVLRVHYPGLAKAGQSGDRIRRVLSNGFGALLSFEIEPDRAGSERFVRGLNRVKLVHSLGGTSTTLSHSLTMTHRAVSAELRERMGLHAGFFRLSVGLEHPDDIWADLEQALARGPA